MAGCGGGRRALLFWPSVLSPCGIAHGHTVDYAGFVRSDIRTLRDQIALQKALKLIA